MTRHVLMPRRLGLAHAAAVFVGVRGESQGKCVKMGSLSYSTLVINDDTRAVGRITEIASALGESVAVVDRRERFLDVYSPEVRCIVLELSMPSFCGIEVIRFLAETNCRAALVLTTDMSPDLLRLAGKLATALGLAVIDSLLAPYEQERLQTALITATDPAAVARLRPQSAASPAIGRG